MAKFKIGDKVKICEWDYMEKKYGLDPWGAIKVPYSFTGDMKRYCGTVRTVKGVYTGTYGTYYRMKEDEYLLYWSEEMFESHQNQSIVIYKKDNKVIALDKATGKTAEAICNPDDKFDFYTGADIAFERLRGRKEAPKAKEEAPKYFTGEIICVEPKSRWFTLGKVYKVKDGRLTDDDGDTSWGRFESVDEINRHYSSKFIEIVK